MLLQLISAKIFIFPAGPTGSGVGANFLMKTGGQEKSPLGTQPKDTGKIEGWVNKYMEGWVAKKKA